MSLIWQIAALATLPLAAYIGLKLPDVDQRIGFLLHRSIITHGPLLPLLAFAFAVGDNPILRRIGMGVGAGLGIHFAFDLFPQSWQGYALISLPIYGWTPPIFSWICLGVALMLSMCFAVKSIRSSVDTAILLVVLASSFWFAASNEKTLWWPLSIVIGSLVIAYWLVGPDKSGRDSEE